MVRFFVSVLLLNWVAAQEIPESEWRLAAVGHSAIVQARLEPKKLSPSARLDIYTKSSSVDIRTTVLTAFMEYDKRLLLFAYLEALDEYYVDAVFNLLLCRRPITSLGVFIEMHAHIYEKSEFRSTRRR